MNHPALPDYCTYELGADSIGTCLQGELNVSYDALVALFGPPNDETDGYKTDAAWKLTFTLFNQFIKPCTIYNYKDGPNYCGEDGTPVEQIRDWHIGGMEPEVLGYVASMLLNPIKDA